MILSSSKRLFAGIFITLLSLPGAVSFSSSATGREPIPSTTTTPPSSNERNDVQVIPSRRSVLVDTAASITGLLILTTASDIALAAKPDCYQDCFKNCKQVVPNDTSNYCRDSCQDYCEQPDRRDGLSGSVSSEGGEVGILGGTFGQGTVVKGADKPPSISLPGLKFDSKEGKQLLG